jgi:FAD:protein FMN transferase
LATGLEPDMSAVLKSCTVQRCKPLLGTFVEITIEGQASESELIRCSETAFTEIARIHDLLSFHDQYSELSRFNRWAISQSSAGFNASDELSEVLTLALQLNRQSDGDFDVCIAPSLIRSGQLPNHLGLKNASLGMSKDIQMIGNSIKVAQPVCMDLGGIAKGYAVDKAIALLPASLRCTINAGGDLRMNHWKNEHVGLQFAQNRRSQRCHLMLAAAVATSGSYYHNGQCAIISPRTARASKRGGSVSVFAGSTMVADALTKIIWLTPREQACRIISGFGAHAISINRFGIATAF